MSPKWLPSLSTHEGQGQTLYAWTPVNIPSYSNSAQPGKRLARCGNQLADLNRRIYILGIGNLGVLLASSLAKLQPRPPITLIFHRKELLEFWISQPGIEISRDGARERNLDFEVEWWTDTPPQSGPARQVTDGLGIRNLVVTTKAPDALPQVDKLRRYLDINSTVAFVHNGMCKLWPPYGQLYINQRYPTVESPVHPNWLACIVTHGVTSRGRFQVDHASQADLKVGPVLLNPSTHEAASYLMDQLVQAPHLAGRKLKREDVWILQLEKLVVNSIINTLTSILRCKNGYLFAKPDGPIVRVMDMLLEEASNVLQALVQDSKSSEILGNMTSTTGQHPIHQDLSIPMSDARQQLFERFSKSELRRMLHDVGFKVRENISSMLQDVRAGKKTEIMEFNGWLVDTAEYLHLGLDTSSHQTLIRLIESGAVLQENDFGEYFPYR